MSISLHTIASIISGTPPWVWAVLALLLFRGLKATRAHTTSLHGPLLLPFIMFAISLSSRHAIAFNIQNATWLASLVFGGVIGVTLAGFMKINIIAEPQPKLSLPGNWTSFVLILLIFISHYIYSVLHAIDPNASQNLTQEIFHAAAQGTLSGIFLGRGITLFIRAQKMLGSLCPTT